MKYITLQMNINEAETLQALLDGSIGAADNDAFQKEMGHLLKKLDKVMKHQKERK
jgi:hypothetical protein